MTNPTASIDALSRDKQEMLDRVLRPIASRDDAAFNALRIKLAEQVIAHAQRVIEAARRPHEPTARLSTIGIFSNPADRRFLVFAVAHESDTKPGLELVKTWGEFHIEKASLGRIKVRSHLSDEQRAFYEAVDQPDFKVVETSIMTREQRREARERETARLQAEGWTLACETWN